MNAPASRRVAFALVAVLLGGCAVSAPPTPTVVPKPRPAESQRLFDEIARQDKAMFEAFNAHDIDALMALFSEDLEFYHDTGGRLTYADVKSGFKSNFDKNNGLRRDLVPRQCGGVSDPRLRRDRSRRASVLPPGRRS